MLIPLLASAQNCDEKLRIARQSKERGDYQLAITQYQAAAADCGDRDTVKANQIKTGILDIFIEIDGLKTKAEKALKEAKIQQEKANVAQKNLKQQYSLLESQKAETEYQKCIAEAAVDSLRMLLQKSNELQNTFPDTNTYKYLYRTGLEHFKYDTSAQARDYQNALTYFALARFLKPNDTLGYLVRCSQKGIAAEQAFLSGDLILAKTNYDSIKTLLTVINKGSIFEDERLRQIQEVSKLYADFSQKTPLNTEILELNGNWWTLPNAFAAYNKAKGIRFRHNLSNFKEFPEVLAKFDQLASVSFENCINIRFLKNWERIKNIQQIIVKDNPNLYALNNLNLLQDLKYLSINNCPALTFVEGCRKLTNFSTQKSQQLRVNNLLLDNPLLELVDMADLTNDSINIANLTNLKTLKLARMGIKEIQGLNDIPRLQTLSIDQLKRLTYFAPPTQLTAVTVNNCDSLANIDNWKPSEYLEKLVLSDNEQLKQIPDWRNYPNLKHILIQNDPDINHIRGTKSLKNVDKIYLINNPNLVTNSVHFGYGYEWGVNITSYKIEVEHRKRTSFFGGNPDLGYKAVAAYAQKKFDYDPASERKSKGFIIGGVINYYSPYWVYTGAGMGFGNFRSIFTDGTELPANNHIVWINNLGAQFAPYFLRKDKLSINMDLYTVFLSRDYYILPSFGLTYYHTLGFHRKTYFIRPGDARRSVKHNKDRSKLKNIAKDF
ncbi:MAG: hypothetical protein RIR11_5192 [Bacteroidota bacterium]|jgi:hypothetical protein